jgi:hypothetical protein
MVGTSFQKVNGVGKKRGTMGLYTGGGFSKKGDMVDKGGGFCLAKGQQQSLQTVCSALRTPARCL